MSNTILPKDTRSRFWIFSNLNIVCFLLVVVGFNTRKSNYCLSNCFLFKIKIRFIRFLYLYQNFRY